MAQTALESLEVARRHLPRVQVAGFPPVDWADLSLYGFYCLEACVVAAALHLGRTRPKNSHPEKAAEARRLAAAHGLPDVGDLLVDLNDRRKFESYGDSDPPEGDLDGEDVAADIEHYFDAVERLLGT